MCWAFAGRARIHFAMVEYRSSLVRIDIHAMLVSEAVVSSMLFVLSINSAMICLLLSREELPTSTIHNSMSLGNCSCLEALIAARVRWDKYLMCVLSLLLSWCRGSASVTSGHVVRSQTSN